MTVGSYILLPLPAGETQQFFVWASDHCRAIVSNNFRSNCYVYRDGSSALIAPRLVGETVNYLSYCADDGSLMVAWEGPSDNLFNSMNAWRDGTPDLLPTAGYADGDLGGASAEGGKIVGYLGDGVMMPVVWDTATLTLTMLPMPSDYNSGGFAFGISPIADTIIGWVHDASWNQQSVLWTAGTIVAFADAFGVDFLPSNWHRTLSAVVGKSADYASLIVGKPDGSHWSVALGGFSTPNVGGVSQDGSVAVGSIADSGVYHAACYTDGALTMLPDLSGESFAIGCSDDGSIVAGYCNDGSGNRWACYWQNGSLNLLDGPASVSGGLRNCVSKQISPDGYTIVGSAADETGNNRIAIWSLPRPPAGGFFRSVF